MNAGGASQMQERAVDAQRDGRFARVAWILLDWAASGFSTVLITLVVAYVKRLVMPDGWWGLEAGVIWAWTLAVAMLASALLTPAAAAWADRRDGHQRAVLAGTVVGAVGLVALAAVPTAAGGAVVAAVIAACVGFDMAQIFTGSLLARIADGHGADRLSARGFAAGYAGGAIALIGATAIVTARDRLGLTMAGSLRLAFAATAAWWLLFSLPAAVARFPGAASGDDGRQSRDLRGFARTIWAAARGEGEYRLAGVLAGAMLALGAIQTAISQFTSLAEQRFDLDGPTLVRLVLLVQAVALPGALAIGWLSLRFGRRAATDVCLGGWVAVLVLAWLVRTPAHLHGVAVLLALVLGGAQSLLRAAVAAAAPPGREGITFGLLQVGTKFAGFGVGVAFGVLQLVGGVPEAGLVAIGVQLAASWWLLRRIA
jgi:UMF1 family MFS transporter